MQKLNALRNESKDISANHCIRCVDRLILKHILFYNIMNCR